MSVDAATRALETYELAYSICCQARREWAELGQPLVLEFKNGMVGIHPAYKALRLAEADAARALEVLRVRRPGPPVRAVVEAQLGQSPAQRLRAVPPA